MNDNITEFIIILNKLAMNLLCVVWNIYDLVIISGFVEWKVIIHHALLTLHFTVLSVGLYVGELWVWAKYSQF